MEVGLFDRMHHACRSYQLSSNCAKEIRHRCSPTLRNQRRQPSDELSICFSHTSCCHDVRCSNRPEKIGRLRLLPQRNNLPRVVIIATLGLSGGWSANQVVHLVTQSGLLSAEAQQKNESEAGAGNLILGGRPEFFIGLRAAMDSPFLGHGSWASDMKYAEMLADMKGESGAGALELEREAEGVIPTHSHILAAWVFAGFLGAVFWAYLFWLVLRALIVVALRRPPLAPIYAWLLTTYSWAILFSPFGSTSRIIEAVTIVIIIDLLKAKTVNVKRHSFLGGSWRRSGWVRPSLTASVPNLGGSRPWRGR